jgi:hypothetical protein
MFWLQDWKLDGAAIAWHKLGSASALSCMQRTVRCCIPPPQVRLQPPHGVSWNSYRAHAVGALHILISCGLVCPTQKLSATIDLSDPVH